MTKRSAKGTLLQYESATGPSVFTTIPGVEDFTIPLGEKDEIDVTTHDSPGGAEETVLGIARLPTFGVPIMWDGANTHHKAIVAAYNADASMNLKITCVDGQVVSGLALVKTIGFNAPVNGKYDANVSFKWAAKPTLTAPA